MASLGLLFLIILIVEFPIHAIILASKGRDIKETVSDKQGVQSSRIGGICMEDVIAFLEEHAQARSFPLRHLVLVVGHVLLRLVLHQVRLHSSKESVAIERKTYVIHNRSNSLIISRLKIVIERLPLTAIPLERPAHPLLERLDLLIRCAGDQDQRRVSGVEMLRMGRQIVRHKRTARTADLVFRSEHEVVDDELLATLEKVCKLDRTVGTGEGVVLVDFHHGEIAELGIESVVGAEGGFFLREKFFAGCEPFGGRYDLDETRY